MPTTRPGYIWSGTEWVAIGQEAIASPFYYQATAPSTPSTGDIWVESDVDVPSIDSTQFLRWRKTMTGGQTSLSGTDDNGLSLQYTPNYEQLYINGVLQVRGQDYTATTGTTVTGLTALVANDVVEVFSVVARAVGDVYTQAQSDSRFVNKSVGGLNLVVPTSVSAGATVGTNGIITVTASNSIYINNCFSATYDNYKLILSGVAVDSPTTIRMRLSVGGSATAGTTNYYSAGSYTLYTGTTVVPQYTNGGSEWFLCNSGTSTDSASTFEIQDPYLTKRTTYQSQNANYDGAEHRSGQHSASTSYDGINLFVSSPRTFSGKIRIYGYNNGA